MVTEAQDPVYFRRWRELDTQHEETPEHVASLWEQSQLDQQATYLIMYNQITYGETWPLGNGKTRMVWELSGWKNHRLIKASITEMPLPFDAAPCGLLQHAIKQVALIN